MNPFLRRAIVAFIVCVAAYFILIKPQRAEAITFETVIAFPTEATWDKNPDTGDFRVRFNLLPEVYANSMEECEAAKAGITSQMQARERSTAMDLGLPEDFSTLSHTRCLKYTRQFTVVPAISFLEPIICQSDQEIWWSDSLDYYVAIAGRCDGQ